MIRQLMDVLVLRDAKEHTVVWFISRAKISNGVPGVARLLLLLCGEVVGGIPCEAKSLDKTARVASVELLIWQRPR